jgi:hypothetical protein
MDNLEREDKKLNVLKNGALQDPVTGKIVKPGRPVITSENAHEFHRMRREKAIAAIQRGIITGTNAKTPFQGLSMIAAAQARLAMDEKRGRASTEAFKALLVAGGFVPSKHDVSALSANTVTVTLSNDALLRLADLFSSEIQSRKENA